jgi:uncharacterized protein DUF4154
MAFSPHLSHQPRTKVGRAMMILRSTRAHLVFCQALVRAAAILTLLALASSGLGGAQQDERAVRAAFVFNLTKYVSWPGRRDHLVIGVVGNEKLGTILKQVLDTKLSDGRPITVVNHAPDSDLGECDVLYVAGLAPAATKSILSRAADRAVLTVGDNDQFVRAGGMVALVRSGDQIEIEVNLPALRSRKLDMSSRLLKLAVLTPTAGGLR